MTCSCGGRIPDGTIVHSVSVPPEPVCNRCGLTFAESALAALARYYRSIEAVFVYSPYLTRGQ